jgi:hypothetical protein
VKVDSHDKSTDVAGLFQKSMPPCLSSAEESDPINHFGPDYDRLSALLVTHTALVSEESKPVELGMDQNIFLGKRQRKEGGAVISNSNLSSFVNLDDEQKYDPTTLKTLKRGRLMHSIDESFELLKESKKKKCETDKNESSPDADVSI